ncbi:hypothetical protein BVU17_13030 [Haloarcula taiwanensis]|uniref:Uncharacterized protein n=1 Tax=Haloarcula taiwanensis TaxID=1932004 RepID=A0A2H5A127_9EURY|nr:MULTISPECIES: hypothetical protein [Haloarcula]AUG48405.1 hypothetical protein BVU17_13030 [Haloarcula taiwanensis]RLM39761.1 hypothetical protein DVK01_04140 [Haloarcula sp. Atlit-120R]RLM47735.1 hypothetical protein DVK00_04295 [Haloarcula sp. Atlit-47R]
MTEWVVPATFALFVSILAVASGPLVGAVDVTQEGPPVGDGSTAVTVGSVPTEQVTLERGRFGSGRYHLDAPPAVLTVDRVAGNPAVRYTIDIPSLWITATSRYELAGTEGTRMGLRPKPIGISPQRINRGSYDAVLTIWIREGDRERQITVKQITIEVQQ